MRSGRQWRERLCLALGTRGSLRVLLQRCQPGRQALKDCCSHGVLAGQQQSRQEGGMILRQRAATLQKQPAAAV